MTSAGRCLTRRIAGLAAARRIRVEATRGYLAASANNPADLTPADIGRLYEVPMKTATALEFPDQLSMRFRKMVRTFDECVWLCREPLIEAINCLRAGVSLTRPSLRLVLWGQWGTGKTITLQQLVHYAYVEGYVVLAAYDVIQWMRLSRGSQNSTYSSALIDTPHYARNVLVHFKAINEHKWPALAEMKTERDYNWSKVELTPAGKPITDIVEMGITAPFLATDCLGALFRELRRHATAGQMRLLVALDQANSLFSEWTIIRKPNDGVRRVYARADELAIVQHFYRFFNNDWTNGACVLVADKAERSNVRDRVTIPRNTPLELFGEEGIDAIDPFIPIETKRYVMSEIDTLYDYFIEREWLTSDEAKTEAGRKQLAYLSAFVPAYYDMLCALH